MKPVSPAPLKITARCPDEKHTRQTIAVFRTFTDQAYYKQGPPYVWIPDQGWRRQRAPASHRQLQAHLITEELVLGGHGLYRPAWTAIDLDQCTAGGAALTAEAHARYLAVQAAVGNAGVPLRSSASGNLHVWVHHAPMVSVLRDQCLARQLAEVAPELQLHPGLIETYPQPRSNHRWPFGRGSVLLESASLWQGVEVPVTLGKLAQIEWLMAQPCVSWPALPDVLTDVRRAPSLPSNRGATGGDQPPGRSPTPFVDRVQRWLSDGPDQGEHNLAMAEVVLWWFMRGLSSSEVEAQAWAWQQTTARHCREWQVQGPEACHRHIRRTVSRTVMTFRDYAAQVRTIEEAGVPASDVQQGLVLFPGDVTLQRAFFAFCRYVRPRLVLYYPDGVMPINAHRQWQAWTERRYKEFQVCLQDTGLCAPAQVPIPLVRSTQFTVNLPRATGETFTSWEAAVWAVCGRDRTVLHRYFSPDQVKRYFPVEGLWTLNYAG